jgi:hypothetical protein
MNKKHESTMKKGERQTVSESEMNEAGFINPNFYFHEVMIIPLEELSFILSRTTSSVLILNTSVNY